MTELLMRRALDPTTTLTAREREAMVLDALSPPTPRLPASDARAILAQLVDVMRRSDPEYARSHGVSETTDQEWDDALQAAEDALEEIEHD